MSAAYIYRGPWINWEHGLIRGATLTLAEESGGLLTAFIATFVTIVGGCLWRVVCYALHQARSSHKPEDGLYHQQQVILRTSPTPLSASWAFFQQTICWTGRVKRSILRSLPWAIFGVLYMVAIALIAVFSASISKSPGPLRLFLSPDCGIWQTNQSSPYMLEAFAVKGANDSLSAAAYAKSCYGGSHNNQTCGKYKVPSIPWTSKQNTTCPFESGTCVFGDTAAYQMVSKLIDSHLDLGINAPKSGRIQVEKTTTCAPLRISGRTESVLVTNETTNTLPGMPGDVLKQYYYGPITNSSASANGNATYTYNLHTSMDSVPYTLDYVMSNSYSASSQSWTPAPEYSSNDSDVTLMFIAGNSITYREPNGDPIFGANYPGSYILAGKTYYYWTPDRYVNVLGCTEQYRICNPVTQVCTRQAGIGLLDQIIKTDADNLALSTLQHATAARMILALQVSSIYYAIFTRLATALRVTETLQGLIQLGLPPTQWQIEASWLFENGLSRLQQKTQEYATGPQTTPRGSFVVHPTNQSIDIPYKAMCYSQLVKDSSDTMSFSVVGLIILFGVGILIVLFSFVQDTLVGFIQTRFKMGLHAWAEWHVTDRLEMHRLLFESQGLGQWEDGWFKTMPVTRKGDEGDVFVGLTEKHLKYTNVNGNGECEAGAQMIEEQFEMKGQQRY